MNLVAHYKQLGGAEYVSFLASLARHILPNPGIEPPGDSDLDEDNRSMEFDVDHAIADLKSYLDLQETDYSDHAQGVILKFLDREMYTAGMRDIDEEAVQKRLRLKNLQLTPVDSGLSRLGKLFLERKIPGTKLMVLIRYSYSSKTVEHVFDPIYADFFEEYFAALSAGKKWHARWIRLRYYKDVIKAVGLFGVVRLAKTAFEYWEKFA